MALGENTEKMLAVRFPHSYHLFEDIEQVCGVVKTQNGGKAEVKFTASGIDSCGRLIVKAIDAGLRFFRRKDDRDECRRIG